MSNLYHGSPMRGKRTTIGRLTINTIQNGNNGNQAIHRPPCPKKTKTCTKKWKPRLPRMPPKRQSVTRKTKRNENNTEKIKNVRRIQHFPKISKPLPHYKPNYRTRSTKFVKAFSSSDQDFVQPPAPQLKRSGRTLRTQVLQDLRWLRPTPSLVAPSILR